MAGEVVQILPVVEEAGQIQPVVEEAVQNQAAEIAVAEEKTVETVAEVAFEVSAV